ncbi:MAG: thioredoxin reductase, partial [Phycisphaerales bacterium]|nr:thioredoxin reductase [Phycisphaerales bacterium]
LELAVALKRRGFDYLHFDAKQIGYTISWFAPATRFFSSNERIPIAGVPLHAPDQSKASREGISTISARLWSFTTFKSTRTSRSPASRANGVS